MLALLKPLAAPIAWGLDTALPEENDTLTRSDVLGLVAVHREIAQEEGHSEPFGAHEEALIKVESERVFLTLLISFFLPFGRTYNYPRCLYVYVHNFRSKLRRSSHLSQGALSLSTLTLSASQLVKPLGPSVFSLPLNARMDAALLGQIMAAGFSRVPIHLPGDDNVLLGYLLTKVKCVCNCYTKAKRKYVRGNMR